MINIEKTKVNGLINYITTLLDFIDVEEEENIKFINEGYDEFVLPLIEKINQN